MLDPQERWRRYGGKPEYMGPLSFGGAPLTQDPAELVGFDVAVLGAPMDELVSDSPGTRYAPSAIRAASCPSGRHLEARIDAFEELRIVDYGDAPVVPAQPRKSHAAIRETVAEVLDAGALPIILGGDHSITEPEVQACVAVHGPLGLIHFDTHTDTAEELYGERLSHGTVMRHLVTDGHVDGRRYVQIGLRGYWPGEAEFAWQAEHGITSLFMHDVRDLGIREVVRRALEVVGQGPAFLTIDIDVLDPGFIPGGTGTPEPGGMSAADLLWAARTVAAEAALVGADLVEVIPTRVAAADPAALVGERVVREILTGIALRRRANVA
jgi:agmatinase